MDLLLEVHLVAQPHRERQSLRDEGNAQNQALDDSGGQFNTGCDVVSCMNPQTWLNFHPKANCLIQLILTTILD